MADQWGLVPLPLGVPYDTPASPQANQPVDIFGGLIGGWTVTSVPTNYTLVAVVGSYAYSGLTATTRAGRKAAGAAGGYTYNGAVATTAAGRKVVGAVGNYAYSGGASTLTKTSGVRLTAETGGYAYTGNAVAFGYQRKFSGEVGSYTLTGGAATLTLVQPQHLVLAATAGTYMLTGNDAMLVGPATDTDIGFAAAVRHRPVIKTRREEDEALLLALL